MWTFVPIFGLGFGAVGAILPLLVQETFGLLAFATIFGAVNFLTMFASLVGPPLVGWSFDASGSYRAAFTVIAGLFMIAAITISFVRPMTPSTSDEPVPARA